MMGLKVMVLEKGPLETICRRSVINEVGSTESLRSTLQWLVGDGLVALSNFSKIVHPLPSLQTEWTVIVHGN